MRSTNTSTCLHKNTLYRHAAALAIMTLISVNSYAKGGRHSDYAEVITATAVYQTVEQSTPQQHCWTKTVREEYRPQRKSNTGTLVGGVIGGVIGNEVGRGSDNKRIGAVVGSLLGMSIGNDISRNHKHPPSRVNYRDVEQCEVTHVTHTEQVLSGYNVRYRYHGREYSTHMNKHPGKRIKVAVDVKPLGH